MDEPFEHVKCLVCEQDNTEAFIPGTGVPQIVRCRSDGLLYLNPRPKAGRVREFHRQYVREDNLELFSAYRRPVLKREAAAIRRLKTSGNLLDVGCATGTFYENFAGPGWQLYGVDTSPLGAEVARSQFGAEVFVGTLREAAYPTSFFDVVSLLDTLYFFSDPAAELREVRRLLKPDGLLAVEIPGLTYTLLTNRGLLSWVLHGNRSGMHPDSWHLYYYSPAAIRHVLQRAGFRVIQMIPEQASVAKAGLWRAVNGGHFALAQLLFHATAGRLSIAGKELYLAVKAPHHR